MSFTRNASLLIALTAISLYSAESDGQFHDLPTPFGAAAAAPPVSVVAGEAPPADAIHFINKPGAYGLGPEIPGSRYAIVAGKLVRLDSKTNKVLSILRANVAIVD
ncbi:hypothetical protein [Paracoccus fistulariae]|uniref:Uncharacterized protein n=1 Tax=Paracoccus fistulariae TaxID=658446 RepID=A0ABY7SMH3_9RHOB|nr:hypothetical protein [Paracoccus fistulariae]MDB6180550.1 hypothetical protein [Paracoccus fistulariae]WCR07207.1 hypothetical protein JHX87_17435 [Paracoccus fistulariae]